MAVIQPPPLRDAPDDCAVVLRCSYRVPDCELALSGAGKTRRHQQVVIADKYQLGRLAFARVTSTALHQTQVTGRYTPHESVGGVLISLSRP